MTKVSCSVSSCSYYKDGGCYVSTVNIGGKGASSDHLTCCGSFLDRQHYSNLAEYTCNRGETETVLCNVNTCKYNENEVCSLNEIHVGGEKEARIYTETECKSYDKR